MGVNQECCSFGEIALLRAVLLFPTSLMNSHQDRSRDQGGLISQSTQLVARCLTSDRCPRKLARPERREPGFASEGRTYALNAKDAGSFMRARGGHGMGTGMGRQ